MTTNTMSTASRDGARKGWVVVGALFLMLAIVITGRNSLGLMMPWWETDPGWSRAFAASAGSIVLILMAVSSPVAGLLLDRLGPRVVATGGPVDTEALTEHLGTDWDRLQRRFESWLRAEVRRLGPG